MNGIPGEKSFHIPSLPVEGGIESPGVQQSLDLIHAYVTAPFDVRKGKFQSLIGLVEFLGTFPRSPLGPETGKHLPNFVAIHTVTAFVGATARGKFDEAVGHSFRDDYS